MTLTAQTGLRRLTFEDPMQLFAQGVGHEACYKGKLQGAMSLAKLAKIPAES